MKLTNVCIAGNFNIAIDCTKILIKNIKNLNLCTIVNENDLGQDHFQNSFKKFCLKNKIKIIKLQEAYLIKDLIFISIHFDKIIDTKKFLSKRLYNIHFSLLPKYKGMHTTAWPIINGEEFSGVTLHKIDNGIDTGPIISQIKFPIKISDNAEKVFKNYIKYGTFIFKKNYKKLFANNLNLIRQKKLSSSYYSKNSLDFKNIKIDFNKTAFEIHNFIRAFTFEYYQLVKFRKKNIKKSKILNTKNFKKPGTIIKMNNKKIIVTTIDYNIELTTN